MSSEKPLRVLIVDDSSFMRRVFRTGLEKRGIEIVGEAENGRAALSQAQTHKPDAITLDLNMPELDGAGVLAELKRLKLDIPVVVVSAFANADRALDLLAQGALEVVAKPSLGQPLEEFLDDLARIVTQVTAELNASTSQVIKLPDPPSIERFPSKRVLGERVPRAPKSLVTNNDRERVLIIISSTGGPKALDELLRSIPVSVTNRAVIVQHMPAGFTHSLAERLDRVTHYTVAEARDGDELVAGTMLMAPGGSHLRFKNGKFAVTDEPPVGGLRPRADLLIDDLAKEHGDRSLLVVLTGLGNDGVAGGTALRANGGRILAQDEASCVVYGMPRSMIEAGLAHRTVSLQMMGAAIAHELQCGW